MRSMILSCRELKLCGCRRLKLTVKGGGRGLCCVLVCLFGRSTLKYKDYD